MVRLEPPRSANASWALYGQIHELDSELLRELEDFLVAIELAEDDALHPGVRDQPKARPTRGCGHVDSGAVDRGAVLRGLHDRVRLRVHRSDAVTVFHQVPDLVAVRQAADRAVVAGG